MKNNSIQIVVAVILVFFLLALGDFLPFWMPNMDAMIVLLIVTVLMLIWAGYIMFEKATDEREIVLRMHAGRIAYLGGVTILTVGLIVQGFAHTIDPWIVGTLCIMVLTKLVARVYEDRG